MTLKSFHNVPFRTPSFAFQELSERLQRAEQRPLYSNRERAIVAPVQNCAPPPVQPYTAYDVEKAIRERVRAYGEEPPRDRLFRYGQWVALVLAVAFIATIVVMMAILSIRLSAAFENLNGDDASTKVNAMMDLAVEGAQNARLATRNVLHMTESARVAAAVATPRLVHAVNETSDLVEDLRSWSFHPSLQIAPGGVATGSSSSHSG